MLHFFHVGFIAATLTLHDCEYLGPLTAGRQRDEDCKRKFVQINNYIKSLSLVMNGINLIQLVKEKCSALFSKQLLI